MVPVAPLRPVFVGSTGMELPVLTDLLLFVVPALFVVMLDDTLLVVVALDELELVELEEEELDLELELEDLELDDELESLSFSLELLVVLTIEKNAFVVP